MSRRQIISPEYQITIRVCEHRANSKIRQAKAKATTLIAMGYGSFLGHGFEQILSLNIVISSSTIHNHFSSWSMAKQVETAFVAIV